LENLERCIAGFEGKTISVAVQDLETGNEIFINSDVTRHPDPANTMKVPVMFENNRK
jgi:hypothetical protein